jgi:hypothetical protein
MVTSTSIEVSHRVEDGWHIFESVQMPGFYVAGKDPRRAYSDIGPSVEKLVKLDTGWDVRVAPEIPFDQFISSARSDLTAAAAMQRFTLFKDAA